MTPRLALVSLLLVTGSAGAAETSKAAAVVCPAPCVDDARSRPKANVEDPRVMKRVNPALAPSASTPEAGSEPAQAPEPKAAKR